MRLKKIRAVILLSTLSIIATCPVVGATKDVQSGITAGASKIVKNIKTKSRTAGATSDIINALKNATTEYECEAKTYYTSTSVNVRTEPNTDCEVYEVLPFNTEIECCEWGYGDSVSEWYRTYIDGEAYYIHSDYLSSEKLDYQVFNIDQYIIFKSYTDYRCITSTSSSQYKLQTQYAYTGNYGIRMVGDRYCCALGSRFTSEIGTLFDIVLENGTVIPCVLSDQKADRHTDATNTYSLSCKCATEFTVDSSALVSSAKSMGDLSYVNESWNSAIDRIIVYDKTIW